MEEKTRMSKLELTDECAYQLISRYLVVDGRECVLELGSRLSDSVWVTSGGRQFRLDASHGEDFYLDPVTGAYGRRYLEDQQPELEKAETLAVIDIDNFKEINDEYGHLAGDAVLRHVANVILSRVNIAGTLVRYGGDEFVLLLSHIPPEKFRSILERIRNRVHDRNTAVREYPPDRQHRRCVSGASAGRGHPPGGQADVLGKAKAQRRTDLRRSTYMNLEEFYAQIGGDYADTLQRLCNENMVKKFVKKYQDDPTCADLHNAALQQDWEAAFRGAHTLKGVAQNLGFERLYQVSAVLTEAMRGEKPLEDRSLLDAVEQQDAAIRRAISELE